ncbi:MAG: NAD-dependent epimerase/dehydratase family protein [Desulfosalsimonadaceae bacterium]|nr:NAD-dependent epimerase/dehydratase family protein [Desulfosalsimonadaceae bacterium]
MKKHALVTGATGFIGARLCKHLSDNGWIVRALVLEGENTDHIRPFAAETVTGNITAPDTLKGVGDGVDAVFHLAARVLDYGSRAQFYAPIFDGTRNMLEACAGKSGRFVYLSSIAACGLGRHLKGFREADTPKKSGVPYNDAKLDAEILVRNFQDRFPDGCTIIRPANVIGPRSVWVDEVLRQFAKGPVPLIDGGRHSASLIYVDNLVDGIIRAATKEIACGRTYQLRDDWDVTWKQYLTDLSALTGKKPFGSVPFSVAWGVGMVAEMLCTPLGIRPPVTRLAAGVMGRDNDVDTTKAKNELGWRTKISYPEAMKSIAEWVNTK